MKTVKYNVNTLVANKQYPLPRVHIDSDRLIFADEQSSVATNPVWDMLWQKKWPGHIAVSCSSSVERVDCLKDKYNIELNDEPYRTEYWTPKWLEWLTENLYGNAAQMQLPGDFCYALDVPGFVHGETQGIGDIFAAKVELLSCGNFHVHPLSLTPEAIADINPSLIAKSLYYKAVEYIKYARATTQGILPFRNPVMTGPIDTANYLLGTNTLLEWLYTEPKAIHDLLGKTTDVLIQMVKAIRDAAGGYLCSHHLKCVRGGFDFCSEVRSLISLDMYEEFEAPYLRRIGQELGAFSVHSCGNWEKNIPNIISDPNFRAMNGQIKENDLATICKLASGNLTLSIGRSVDVHDRFIWPSTESYYRHILETVPNGQPFELTIEKEEDINLWGMLHRQIRGNDYQWTPPSFGNSKSCK